LTEPFHEIAFFQKTFFQNPQLFDPANNWSSESWAPISFCCRERFNAEIEKLLTTRYKSTNVTFTLLANKGNQESQSSKSLKIRALGHPDNINAIR
jgi:hypothetical protein